jgi:hypothetical protein
MPVTAFAVTGYKIGSKVRWLKNEKVGFWSAGGLFVSTTAVG